MGIVEGEPPEIKEYRRTYIKLPQGQVRPLVADEVIWDSSNPPRAVARQPLYNEFGEAVEVHGATTGPESHLTGARTVPFLETEETRSKQGGILGPSSRYVNAKLYQNEYIFKPEEPTRNFADDFETSLDKDGEVIWVNKCRREHSVRYAQKKLDEVKRKEVMQNTEGEDVARVNYCPHFYDSYTGQGLVEFRGNMCYKSSVEEADPELFDFDNLRFDWLGERPNRNKQIHMGTYNWFDRHHNPYIERDTDFEFEELEASYVDPSVRNKWRLRGGNNPIDIVNDVIDYLHPDP